jgi:hypothetical protein
MREERKQEEQRDMVGKGLKRALKRSFEDTSAENLERWRDHLRSGTLRDATKPYLERVLESLGESHTGNKDELFERLRTHMSHNQNRNQKPRT